MPVDPNTPKPLFDALSNMEASVQSAKRSLAYAAPEMQDTFWIMLQNDIANAMTRLYYDGNNE